MIHLIFLCMLTFITSAHCELFTSTEDVKILVNEHENLVVGISSLIKNLEVNVAFLKWKLKVYKKDQRLMDKNVEAFVSNPLNAFTLIKKLTIDAQHISNFIYNAVEQFESVLEPVLVGQDDLQGAVEGIDRLQTTYNLKTGDLANGIIDDDSFNMTLSSHDLYIIAVELEKNKKYSRAIEYFIEALKKNQKLEDFGEVSDEEILTGLMIAYEKTGKYEKEILAIDDLLLYNPENFEALLDWKKTLKESLKLGFVEEFDEPEETSEEKLTRTVCSGELKQSFGEISKLHCRYESRSSFAKLAPFKLEEANLDPLIVVFHDVMSETEIGILKELASPLLNTAQKSGDFDESKSKVLKVAWLQDKDHKVIGKISKRIEDMTGLATRRAEDLQVRQHGVGGFYRCHHEFEEKFQLEDDDDRIATTLFYLSDIEKGGHTVFPYLKVRIVAEKGSAAFWYNLHDSGEGDYKIRHSGCPVLVGNKWEANKWLHEKS